MADRWVRTLHDLYLVTLVIAFVATAVSFPTGLDWLVAGTAAATPGGVDIAVRRQLQHHAGQSPCERVVQFVGQPLALLRLAVPFQRAHGAGDEPSGSGGEGDGDAARLVTRARETAGACLVDTRRAVAALRPEPLDHTTFADAVRQLCARVPATCEVRGTAVSHPRSPSGSTA